MIAHPCLSQICMQPSRTMRRNSRRWYFERITNNALTMGTTRFSQAGRSMLTANQILGVDRKLGQSLDALSVLA
jgi:hypothetical protein